MKDEQVSWYILESGWIGRQVGDGYAASLRRNVHPTSEREKGEAEAETEGFARQV